MRLRVSSARRAAAGAVTIALATLGLAACGVDSDTGSDKPAELSKGDVNLRVNWWGSDARTTLTQKAIDAFEKKHPNIHVTGEFSDWNGYWDKLATATAGGNAPDVIQMDQLYLASYADRGALADLSKLSQLDTSGIDNSVLGMGRTHDGQYAMPISTAAFGLLINKDKLHELGLTLPDTNTWTWDQFDAFARSITEKSGGKTYGVTPWNNEYSLQLAARQAGDQLFKDGQIAIKPETLAGYFQRALDWSKDGASQPASQFAEQASGTLDQSDFATGKTAMIFSQVSQLTAYAAAAGDANVVIAKLPTDDANAGKYFYFKPGMYWSVSAKSAHPAEAALFVNFMVNDPEAGAILGTERGLPANPAIVKAITGNLNANEKKVVDYTDAMTPDLGAAPEIVPNGASDTDTLILRYLQDVLFAKKTPQQAADGLISEVKSGIEAAK
jgi:multiple sugar transport system substrate-binding protein